MHPTDCPEFEYSTHPDHSTLLRLAQLEILDTLHRQRGAISLADSRPFHRRMFKELCPLGHDYFAGHYRGESFRCLKRYEVCVEGDPRVGYPAREVHAAMAVLADRIRTEMADATHSSHHLPRAEKLVCAVALACQVFVNFLTIHPYANGNGHVARLLLTWLMMTQGYRVMNFPIEPRPPDPPYSELIQGYRDGHVEPLERYIMERLG